MKDQVLSFNEMCGLLGVNMIQRGMNFHVKGKLSVILFSEMNNSPYEDQYSPDSEILTYEGHDVSKGKNFPNPKKVDQPIWNQNGTLTDNGKFIQAIEKYRKGLAKPEEILAFEKIKSSLWKNLGKFYLIDYNIVEKNNRKVFKFILKTVKS